MKRLAIIAAVLVAAACAGGGDSSTGPKNNGGGGGGNASGVYELRQVKGTNMPVEIYHGPYFDAAKPHFYNQLILKALRGAFALNRDGTYNMGVTFSVVGDGQQSEMSIATEGEYEVDGDEIVFEDYRGFSLYGSIANGVISITFKSPLTEDERSHEYTFRK